MKHVKVFGTGCKRCETTETMIKDTATRLGVEVTVEKVTDPTSIAMAGVLSTPGVAVDDQLVHAGGLPDPGQLKAWLTA